MGAERREALRRAASQPTCQLATAGTVTGIGGPNVRMTGRGREGREPGSQAEVLTPGTSVSRGGIGRSGGEGTHGRLLRTVDRHHRRTLTRK